MPTFRHGKRTAVFAGGADLSPYLNDATVSGSAETGETTAFGSDAKTYVAGPKDGTLTLGGMFDGTEKAVDEVLATLADADVDYPLTVLPEGAIVGRRASIASVKKTNYEIASPVSDVVAVSAEFQASDGIDRGMVLAAGALTAALTGTGQDNGAATTNGGVAVLHATANTRDGATVVKVQHSADNITFVDLVTFSSVGAGLTAGERIVVPSGTAINRYLRATATLAGSTGSITITATFARR